MIGFSLTLLASLFHSPASSHSLPYSVNQLHSFQILNFQRQIFLILRFLIPVVKRKKREKQSGSLDLSLTAGFSGFYLSLNHRRTPQPCRTPSFSSQPCRTPSSPSTAATISSLSRFPCSSQVFSSIFLLAVSRFPFLNYILWLI